MFEKPKSGGIFGDQKPKTDGLFGKPSDSSTGVFAASTQADKPNPSAPGTTNPLTPGGGGGLFDKPDKLKTPPVPNLGSTASETKPNLFG